MTDPDLLRDMVGALAEERLPCAADVLNNDLERALAVLDREDAATRPRDRRNRPGGLVRLPPGPAIIVPDLHARTWVLHELLSASAPAPGDSIDAGSDAPQETVASALIRGALNLVCLGDVLHAEGYEASLRWQAAMRGDGAAMDLEMSLALSCLRAVLFLKAEFPEHFHILKGNHDNMGNADSDGDLQFYKYAMEGAMGAEWFRARYGKGLLARMRAYERALPLAACGEGFCASHAEPGHAVDQESLREYRERPALVRSLIWTANGEAEPASTRGSLRALLGSRGADGLWFAGHRLIRGDVGLRDGGFLVQLHQPEEGRACWVQPRQGGRPGLKLGRCPGAGAGFTWSPLRLDPPGP